MKKEERLVRALHKWRDGVARDEDESPRYILGKQPHDAGIEGANHQEGVLASSTARTPNASARREEG